LCGEIGAPLRVAEGHGPPPGTGPVDGITQSRGLHAFRPVVRPGRLQPGNIHAFIQSAPKKRARTNAEAIEPAQLERAIEDLVAILTQILRVIVEKAARGRRGELREFGRITVDDYG
jgi:hypothetical protein